VLFPKKEDDDKKSCYERRVKK